MAADATLRFDTKMDFSGFEKSLSNINKLMGSAFKAGSLIIGGVTTALEAAGLAGVKYAMTLESITTNLTTLRGSAELAVKDVKFLADYAAKTPFELPGLTKAYETFLAFDLSAEKAIESIQLLGDVSLGNQDKFNLMALAFGQIASKGKLLGQDLKQLQEQGFNPLIYISKATGESLEELQDRMSYGVGVSAEEVANAFRLATSEGEKFYKAMDNASKTAKGQMSTLKDNVLTALASISSGFTENLTVDFIPFANQAVEDIQESFKTAGYEGLAETLGNVIGEALTKVAESLPAGIELSVSLLKNVAKSLNQNIDIIYKAGAQIGEALVSSIFGKEIGESFGKFSDTLKIYITQLVSVIGPPLEVLGKTFSFLFETILENGEFVISTLTGIGTAMVLMSGYATIVTALSQAWKIAGTALMEYTAIQAASLTVMSASQVTSVLLVSTMTMYEIVVGALTGKIKLLTAAQAVFLKAQQALSLALAGGSFLPYAIAIGATVAAFTALSIAANKVSEDVQQAIDKQKEMFNAMEKTRNAVAESNKAYSEQNQSFESNAIIAENLIDKLDKLGENTKRTEGQKKEMLATIGQLNAIYPQLQAQYDSESDTLVTSTKLLREKNQALLDQASAQAVYERLVELQKEELALQQKQKELAEQDDPLAEQKQKAYEKQLVLNEAMNTNIYYKIPLLLLLTKQEKLLADSYAESTEQTEENAKAIEIVQKSIKDLIGGLKEYDKNVLEVSGSTETLNETNEKAAKLNKEFLDTVKSGTDNFKSLAESQDATWESLVNLVDENQQLFETYPELNAAIDKNANAQVNAKNVAVAMHKIKIDLMKEEKLAYIKTTEDNIKTLETQKDLAIRVYSAMTQAAILAANSGNIALSQALDQRAMSAKERSLEIDSQIKQAEAQVKRTKEFIEKIGSTPITFDTGGGGGRSRGKTAFEKAKEDIEDYTHTLDATVEGELERWKKLLEAQKKGTDNWREVNNKVLDLEKEFSKERIKLEEDAIKERLENQKLTIEAYKRTNEYTLEGEKAFYDSLALEYADDAKLKNEFQQKSYELTKEILEKTKDEQKKAIDKQIDNLEKVRTKEVDLATKSRDTRLKLIDDTTTAAIRGTNKELDAFLDSSNQKIRAAMELYQLIDSRYYEEDQAQQQVIEGIKAEQEARAEATRERRDQEALRAAQERIANAKTEEERIEAQKEYDEVYRDQLEAAQERNLERDLRNAEKVQKEKAEIAKKAMEEQLKVIEDQTEAQEKEVSAVIEALKLKKEDIDKAIIEPLNKGLEEAKPQLEVIGGKTSKSITGGMNKSMEDDSKDFMKSTVASIDAAIEETNLERTGYNLFMSMEPGIMAAIKPLTDIVVGGIKSVIASSNAELAAGLNSNIGFNYSGIAPSSSNVSTNTVSNSNNYFIFDQATGQVKAMTPLDMFNQMSKVDQARYANEVVNRAGG